MDKNLYINDMILRFPSHTFTETAIDDEVLVEFKDGSSVLVAQARAQSSLAILTAYQKIRFQVLSREISVFLSTTTQRDALTVNSGTEIFNVTTSRFETFDGTVWVGIGMIQDELVTINFIIDGGGATITTGIKGHLIVDLNLEVLEWAAVADQSGSIVVDVNRSTFSGYPTTASIAGTELPTITTSTKGEDRTLTSWSDIDAGDVLEFQVDSITDLERVTVALKCRKI